MSILSHAWREFERLQMGPATASPTTPEELRQLVRRAFFTGAYTHREILGAVADMAPADQAVQMQTLNRELAVFAATVHTELEGLV